MPNVTNIHERTVHLAMTVEMHTVSLSGGGTKPGELNRICITMLYRDSKV